jgi:hypothetical protein
MTDMRSLAIVGLVACVGCAVGTKEESLFPEDAPASETKSAPAPAAEESEGQSPYAAWHHWSTVDVPTIADGVLELNVAETPERPIAANQITVFDAEKKPIGTGYRGWFTASVAAGTRYYVDVFADPSKGDVKLLQSFKPVIDAFEPNDDIDHATVLTPGKAAEVRVFAPHGKKDADADYFRLPAKGKRSVRLFFANGSGATYCIDVIGDGSQPVGGTCSSADLDAAFLMPEHSGNVFVRVTGPSGAETSTLTVTADY